MATSEFIQEFKRQLLKVRSRAMGLRSDDHWLRLSLDLRKVLSQGFDGSLSDETIANFISLPQTTIATWRLQRTQIAELKKRLTTLRAPGKRKLSQSVYYRPEVAALAKIIPLLPLARELGLTRSTVRRWVADGWGQVAVEDWRVTGPSEELIQTMTANAPAKESIAANDPEGKELALLVKRHAGKTRKKYSATERKLILSLVERFGTKAVHDEFGPSFETISRMLRHQKLDSERKIRVPIRYAPVLDLMKQHPGMGPMQVRDYIKRHMGLGMSVNSIRKVMELHGWVPPFVRIPRVKDGIQLYEAVRRNYLWHTDFKHQYINSCKVFIIFFQDDYSRFIVNYAVADGEKVETVMMALDEAIRLHGKPEVLMSDGGSAFYSWRGVSQLTRMLEDYGIDQHIAKTPNVNGKLENLNQQVEKEVLLVNNFASLDHFGKELAAWISFYNFRRPHQGIGGAQVPADRFYPGACKWYSESNEQVKQQSLIAETMATLLLELRRPK
jgi:transposase InsO family protein